MSLAKAKAGTAPGILPHNAKAGATWGSAGRHYDKISETIADAIEHTVVRVAPRARESFLDIATGTGWAARRIRAHGANVVGIDIGAGVIEAARELSPDVEFHVGDAEALPFDDASFDGVVSTFGVMFVARPEDAAREMARVCRKGGRLGLVTWLAGDTLEGLFKVMRPYMPPPSGNPPPSPFEWGKQERIRELLGGAFELEFEQGTTVLRMPTGQAAWDLFVESYGPTKTIAANCDPQRRKELERDFAAFHDQYHGPLGVAMPRQYIVTIGKRK